MIPTKSPNKTTGLNSKLYNNTS